MFIHPNAIVYSSNKMKDEKGFTFIEMFFAVSIVGVLSAVTIPLFFWANKPIENSVYQTSGILSQARSQAIATSSSIRVSPSPNSPQTEFKVETSHTQSCNPTTTQLTKTGAADSTLLTVDSTQGLAIGEQIKVGSDDADNIILTTDPEQSTIVLGKPLGTSQAVGSSVEIISNWIQSDSFSRDTVTLPEDITMTSNLRNWTLCYDEQGIATISDESGIVDEDLEIILQNLTSKDQGQIIVSQSGIIDIAVVPRNAVAEAPATEAIVTDTSTTESTNSEISTDTTDSTAADSATTDSSSSFNDPIDYSASSSSETQEPAVQ